MKKFLALFLALAMLLGCVSFASADELPTITIMFHGSNVADDAAVLEKVNEYIADIISGIILFCILGSEFFINYKMIFRTKKNDKEGGKAA